MAHSRGGLRWRTGSVSSFPILSTNFLLMMMNPQEMRRCNDDTVLHESPCSAELLLACGCALGDDVASFGWDGDGGAQGAFCAPAVAQRGRTEAQQAEIPTDSMHSRSLLKEAHRKNKKKTLSHTLCFGIESSEREITMFSRWTLISGSVAIQ